MGQMNCTTAGNNTGRASCRENFGMVKKYVWVPNDADGEFAARADAGTLANWIIKENAASMNDRFKPSAKIFSLEVNDEDAVYDTGSDGDLDEVREGKYDRRVMFLLAMCEHVNYRALNDGSYSMYKITANGYILGTTDGTKFAPFSLSTLKVEKQTPNDGTVTDKTPVRTVESDPTEWNDRFWWVKPTTWNPLTDLDGVQDVDLSVNQIDGNSSIVTVVRSCGQDVVVGLVEADFTLVDAAGNDETGGITSVTDNGDGTYTFAFAPALGADTYTYNLKNPASMTTKGYESSGSVDGVVV